MASSSFRMFTKRIRTRHCSSSAIVAGAFTVQDVVYMHGRGARAGSARARTWCYRPTLSQISGVLTAITGVPLVVTEMLESNSMSMRSPSETVNVLLPLAGQVSWL